MSTYYRSETQLSSPYSAYMIVGSMSCSLTDSPIGQQQCPQQTVDFNRVSGFAIPSDRAMQMGPTDGPGYNMLGSAYPVIVSAPFKLYENTNY